MKTPQIMFGYRLALLACSIAVFALFDTPCPAQTPPLPTQQHNPQAQAHRDQGDSLESSSDYPSALREYQAAYALDKATLAYRQDAGTDLINIGHIYLEMGQNSEAIDVLQQALRIAQSAKDTSEQASILNNMGLAYFYLSQYDKAITFYQQALTIHQKLKEMDGQAGTLMNLGIAYNQLSQYDKAIRFYQKAIALYQKVKDAEGQAGALNNLGLSYNAMGQYEKAIDVLQQALTIHQKFKDIDGQADSLMNLGNAYTYLSQYDKAIDFLQQALPLFQQVKDKGGEAKTLNSLGNAYLHLSQYDKAIQYYQQALTLHQQVNDIDAVASNLTNLGLSYTFLSQYDKAIDCYQQALTIYQQVKDTDGQAKAITNLGTVYDDLSQYDKAVQYYQQALPLFQQIKDIEGEASDLTNLGNAYEDRNQYDKAAGCYQQALPLFEQLKDQDGQADTLTNLGISYFDLSQFDKAIGYYLQAIPIFQQVKDRSGEALTLHAMMAAWSARTMPRLAIFYGKQAVNVYQSIRQDLQGMDQQTQKTYLKAKEPTYRQLAELLIHEGRLPEAEQVLNLLKNQEFFDFIQRDAAHAPEAGQAALTPVEEQWQKRYDVIADKVTAIGQTKQDLLTKQQQAETGKITLTAPQKTELQKNLTQADNDLIVANKAFQDFLTQLAQEAQNAPKAAQDRVETVTDATAFEDTLSQLGPGTVALYTIVEPDKVRILVVTSQTQIAREYPIKDTDLRAKVLAFRQVLQDPTRDPRPLGHELYTILVGPIEKDLAGANAQTLMWSLDDVLRYLPTAALYDGKQYLVERYRMAVFTPASESRLTETPKAQWNGLGLGVSQAYPGFAALTGVPQELNDVIHDPTVAASQTGALPGTILLDTAFTQQAMTQALEARKYPLVHIASHFDFQPGDETASFLLLGDGSHLSLSTIKTLPQIFQGVDLLTLSACDTADGSAGADGREVEGFAVLAQRLGAKAVIASLWPVADASTPLLMETFYRQHAAVPEQPKAEALRQAQLALLHGTVSGSGSGPSRAQIVPGKAGKSTVDAPPYTADPKAPFAHPYYWAPFILIGNWR